MVAGFGPAMTGVGVACAQTKTAGSFDPAASSPDPPIVAKTQLAFFTNTGLPTFFSIARFRSSARGESTSALALIGDRRRGRHCGRRS